jgi:HEAT repeat protein
LGEIRSKEAARRLVEAAGSKDTERRVEALYGLVKQNDPVLWPHLVSALKSKKYEIKVPGAICCGLVRASGATDLLLRGLDDTKNDYAYFCAWALGQMRDPKILGRVVAATKGRMSGEVGTAKAKAIIECALPEDKHVDILIGLARASDEAIAGAAAGALGRVGGSHPEAADALLALVVRSGTPTLSSLAADALARIGGPEHGAKILARHKANPGNVPAHAIKALGLLKTVGADGLLLQVANRSRSHALRKRAAIAFWQCADRAARDKFRQRLEAATQEKVVAAGCLVLGFHRAEEGFQFAVQLLRRHYGKKKVVRHVRAAGSRSPRTSSCASRSSSTARRGASSSSRTRSRWASRRRPRRRSSAGWPGWRGTRSSTAGGAATGSPTAASAISGRSARSGRVSAIGTSG